jgi:hypothetical protein
MTMMSLPSAVLPRPEVLALEMPAAPSTPAAADDNDRSDNNLKPKGLVVESPQVIRTLSPAVPSPNTPPSTAVVEVPISPRVPDSVARHGAELEALLLEWEEANPLALALPAPVPLELAVSATPQLMHQVSIG